MIKKSIFLGAIVSLSASVNANDIANYCFEPVSQPNQTTRSTTTKILLNSGSFSQIEMANEEMTTTSSNSCFGVVKHYRVLFNFDKAQLLEGFESKIKEIDVEMANGNRLVIEGHADEHGTKQYNHSLSLKRANTLKDYLVSKGIKQGNPPLAG